MSSCVCGDQTILAIVEGMRRHGMIARKKGESRDMCDALRFIDEYQSAKRYVRPGNLRRWYIECVHQPITEAPRTYSDDETISAIDAYLGHVDSTGLHDFDFITLISAVRILRKKVIESV